MGLHIEIEVVKNLTIILNNSVECLEVDYPG